MTEEQDRFQKIANRYNRIGVVGVFVYALLHSLGGLVFWIVGAAAGGAFALSVYYRRLANPPSAAQPTWQRPGPASPAQPPNNPDTERVRKLVRLVPLILIGSVFAFVVWVIINSDSPTEPTGENTTSTDDLSSWRNAVNQNPNDADALLNLGNAFFNKNQYDSARYFYNRTLTINPAYKEALYNIALSWFNQREFSQATNTLQKCLQANPGYGEALQLMGNCYYEQDQKDQALTFYQRAYDNGLRNAELTNYLGYLYDLQSNASRAIEFYKETIGQDSSRVEVYKRLAELEPDQSEVYLRKVKELEGN